MKPKRVAKTRKMSEAAESNTSDPLIAFEQVMSQTINPHLLLGNGFSISYDPKRFSFTTLLESAVEKGVIDPKSELYEVFKKLETADFERVMRSLDDSKKILAVYGIDAKLQKKLSSDSAALKEYLVKIVTNNHPEKSTSVLLKEKQACLQFLSKFDKIYTLNYDLLLYWSSMQDVSEKFTDGYGNTEDSIHEGYVVYKNLGSQQMSVHYLHGALHYFDAGDEIIKKTYSNTDVNLVEQIRDSLNQGIYPIFISEGNTEQKKTKILHNAYLNHCYRSLRAIKGDIVVFGASLKENDRHILEALSENGVKRIFLGVSNPSAGEHVKTAIEEHNRKSDARHQKELIYFDYRTVDVWGRGK